MLTLDNEFSLVLDQELPVRLLPTGSHETDEDIQEAPIEQLRVKLLLKGDASLPLSVKLEVQSETDIFFHFVHEVEEDDYRSLQQAQSLRGEFSQYLQFLHDMLSRVTTDK